MYRILKNFLEEKMKKNIMIILNFQKVSKVFVIFVKSLKVKLIKYLYVIIIAI